MRNIFSNDLLLLLISWAYFALQKAYASTHSHQCIQALGDIRPCADLLTSGVFRGYFKLRQCCAGVREIVRSNCECNDMVTDLIGGNNIYRLETVCRVVHPVRWTFVARRRARNRRQCPTIRNSKADYQCETISDIELDRARYASINLFSDAFINNTDESRCFDTPDFIAALNESMREDATFHVPYGAGLYTGLASLTEYVALSFGSLTHGMWQLNNEVVDDPYARARFDLIDEDQTANNTWTTGATSKAGTFLRGALPYPTTYKETSFSFRPCETKIDRVEAIATDGLVEGIVEPFAQIAQFSKRYGIEDICRFHTDYCVGDLQQYSSEDECLETIRALPLYTDMCGIQRAFYGNSLLCKWKHHIMVPANPSVHCFHIGKDGTLDSNGDLKCNDVEECTTDEGQDSWVPLRLIGNATPGETITIIEADNVGYEDEPFPCVIPVS